MSEFPISFPLEYPYTRTLGHFNQVSGKPEPREVGKTVDLRNTAEPGTCGIDLGDCFHKQLVLDIA